MKYDYIILIGRFMPFHNAHKHLVELALPWTDKVIILLGSANQARTVKNPWTWEERKQMILASFPNDADRLIFAPIEDTMYNDQQWVTEVQETIYNIITSNYKDGEDLTTKKEIGLIGCEKDDSSYYLKMFPQWKFHGQTPVKGQVALNATDVRAGYFDLGIIPDSNYAPEGTRSFLYEFMKTDEYDRLVREYKHLQKYKQAWSVAPYPPTFVTVDSVVITSGHVLAVRRKAAPGEGLLALPGGFLDHNEQIVDSMIRELREETKLKVPDPVLRGSIKTSGVFDHPNRSLRGRTITHAFLIELEPTTHGLPKVKGGSDAQKAEWIPLSQALKMGDQWFEDHLMILKHFVGEI